MTCYTAVNLLHDGGGDFSAYNVGGGDGDFGGYTAVMATSADTEAEEAAAAVVTATSATTAGINS